MVEQFFEMYPIYESLMAGLILSIFMGAITTNTKQKTRRAWYVYVMRMLSLFSGILIAFLFVEFNETSFRTVDGYQQWLLQFVIIYSVSEAVYKFGGKTLVNKVMASLIKKIGA